MKKIDKINKIVFPILFILYLINIFCFPVLSHMENKFVHICVNAIEYIFIVFALYFLICKFLQKDIVLLKSSIFIIIFVLLSAFSFIVFSNKNIDSLSVLFKIAESSLFFVYSLNVLKSKRKILIVCITILVGISTQFIATLFYNLKTPQRIIEAFTGGKYRLGNDENQANGYATYCFYMCIVIFILSVILKRKFLNLFILIPTFICFGTQSKKGIILCVAILIFSYIYIISNFKKGKTRIILYSVFAAVFIGSLIFVILKTDLLSRFFQKTDDSTITRLNMFKYMFLNFDNNFLIGKGINTFRTYFYLNNGTDLVFHSTIGDCCYSLGLVGLITYIGFVFSIFFRNKKYNIGFWKAFMVIIFCCQILSDLTASIWYIPISFILLALYPSIEDTYKFVAVKEQIKDEYLCLEI